MAIRLHELTEALPEVSDPPELREGARPHIRYVETGREDFVEPPLSLQSGALDEAQVVVVSAPAAVGKTMLAEHLAQRTRGALWNLAGFHVGNDFAIGALARAHGPEALGEVLGRLRGGSFVVIADALDEARFRVSFDAFVAFLDDLYAQLLADATPGRPPVVLLARGETAEFAAEWLRELGASVADVRIDFFDREDAEEFVRRQLRTLGKDPDQAAMVKARNAMFAHILTLLGIDTDIWPPEPARRFLGYAPVLVAVTRYLASGGNPQRLAEQFSSERTPEAMWEFLIALIRDILWREQEKFVTGFREAAGAGAPPPGFTAWDSLFTPREQRSWLLSEALGTPEPPVAVPRELEARYREQVRSWLAEHPLVGASRGEFASEVFADFLYAEALVDGESAERAAVRARVADVSYRPTEMLARFVFALANGAPRAHADDLPALYESLAAGEEPGRPAELELTDDDRLEAAMRLGDERFELPLSTNGGAIVFNRKLARASVRLQQHEVRLGIGGRSFEIGPDVAVSAPAIEIAAESLLVHGGIEDAGDVVISGEKVIATNPGFRVVRGGDHLKVRARDTLRYPLVEMAIREDSETPPLGAAEREAAQVLFRLLGFFKSEGYGGLGSYAEPIDQRAGKNERFGRMLIFARERGLITRAGAIYKLHPETVGLDYLKVKAQIVSDEAADFLRAFVAAELS